jgi:transcriptional regulator with XRE-family HTH domain
MSNNALPDEALPQASTSPVGPEDGVRKDDLGKLISTKRQKEQLTLDQAAKQSGVSAATLSRLERQYLDRLRGASGTSYPAPDTRTLVRVTRWLGVSLERVTDGGPTPPIHAIVHHEGETVPDMVEAHLRADRNLDSKTAAALSRLFRAAYEQLADLSDASSEESNQDEPKTDD